LEYSSSTHLSFMRQRILRYLSKGYIVWILKEPGPNASEYAASLLRSKQFRKSFIPLISRDVKDYYAELLMRGGWCGTPNAYYFIDDYGDINARLYYPSIIVGNTINKELLKWPKLVIMPKDMSLTKLENLLYDLLLSSPSIPRSIKESVKNNKKTVLEWLVIQRTIRGLF